MKWLRFAPHYFMSIDVIPPLNKLVLSFRNSSKIPKRREICSESNE